MNIGVRESERASDTPPCQQTLDYPSEPDYKRHIVGVRKHIIHNYPLQMIFSDSTVTGVSQSLLTDNLWKEVRIPADSHIRKVEVMYRKYDSCCFGLKFLDQDNNSLLQTSKHFDDHEFRASDRHRFAFHEFTLN